MPRPILIDIDVDYSEFMSRQYYRWLSRYEELSKAFNFQGYAIYPSSSNHVHIVVYSDVEPPLKYALAVLLGSDVKRECFNFWRFKMGLGDTSMFFQSYVRKSSRKICNIYELIDSRCIELVNCIRAYVKYGPLGLEGACRWY